MLITFSSTPATPPLDLLYFVEDLNAWPPATFNFWAKRLSQLMRSTGLCVSTLSGDGEDRVLTTLAELLELRVMAT